MAGASQEMNEAILNQIFGVVGSGDIPTIWYFADSIIIHLFLIILGTMYFSFYFWLVGI